MTWPIELPRVVKTWEGQHAADAPEQGKIIGTIGDLLPDGTADLELTEEGKRLFGPNMKVRVVMPEPKP